jgi:hypothetical protein
LVLSNNDWAFVAGWARSETYYSLILYIKIFNVKN